MRNLTRDRKFRAAVAVVAPFALDAACHLLDRGMDKMGLSGESKDAIWDRLAALGTQDELVDLVAAGIVRLVERG